MDGISNTHEEIKNAYNILVGKPVEKTSIGNPRLK
jgi:hypothetical protein